MKRLVLLGEGHGDVSALPVLVKRLLQEKDARRLLFVDPVVIRTSPSRLVKWDKATNQPDYSEWIARIELAARRRDVGGVLAVYDGDFPRVPRWLGLALLCGHRGEVHGRGSRLCRRWQNAFPLCRVCVLRVRNMVGGRGRVVCRPQVV